MRDSSLWNRPPKNFDLDLAGVCNLHCTFCPEGQKMNQQPVKFMSLQDFTNIFETLPDDLTSIGLTNWSEPFLNRDIVEIIKYVKTHRPHVEIWVSSNGTAFRQNMLEGVVLAGLDTLEISISGLTQEIYEKYHVDGKLERIYNAIDELTRSKQKHNSLKPNVTINYLQFPYNVSDEETIRTAIAQRLSHPSQMDYLDTIRIVRGTMLGSPSMLQTMKSRFRGAGDWFKRVTHFKNQCMQIFLYPAVRADGEVFPCCIAAYSEDLKMGNLHNQGFDEIWHSDKYTKFRSDFLAGKNPVCNDCLFHYSYLPLFRKDFFKVRLKLNLKLLIQLVMKAFFVSDRKLLRGKLFRIWVSFRLKRTG